MTLPTGAISLSQVNAELSQAATAPISLGQTHVRNLAGVPSGPISMSNLRGKSAYTPMTVVGYDVYDNDYATGTQYTDNWYPQVAVTAGGVPGFTYLWTFISNPNSFTLVTNNIATGRVSHLVSKFGFTGSCTLNCRVTDGSGNYVDRTVTVTVTVTVDITNGAAV